MKHFSVALNVVLVLAVGILYYLHFSAKKQMPVEGGAKDPAAVVTGNFKIAYVDIDSLEAHYVYFKEKKNELDKKQAAVDNELSSSARALQNEAAAFQQKVNAGGVSQAEGEATQRSLMQKQQQLQIREQTLKQQLMEQQAKFQEELQKRLDDFLSKYNEGKNYAYILSYSKGLTNILYKNTAFDITNEVIAGLNAEMKAAKK